MALEDLLTKLIASLDANTAAYKTAGSPGVTATTGKTAPAPTAAAGKSTEPKEKGIGFDELKVAGGKVMDKHGKPFTKKLIKDVGEATELATVKPEKYKAMMAAFQKALEAAPTEDDEDEL
jgi:hypothetical protein